MLSNKLLLKLALIILGVNISACIEEYKPIVTDQESNKYVIFGNVTNIQGFSTIIISKSSDIDAPKHIPVINCEVCISGTVCVNI